MNSTTLPTDSQERKGVPLARGFLYYFPAAMAEVARLSKHGNDKHNPGEPLHHARGKSTDHADCILRHQAEWDQLDDDGFYHAVKVAWRAMAQLQELMESKGAPLAPRALLPGEDPFEKFPGEMEWQPDVVDAAQVSSERLTQELQAAAQRRPPGDRVCRSEDECLYPGCICPRRIE